MSAGAWAWLGWFSLSVCALIAAAEWVYDEYIDPPADEEDE